ncbi:hypothetical protein OEZ86_003131 [Tetradesmus obliquus]|nr:hypothetical protein OEZ86_003131 [Tetradesmus obliquus]
MQLLHASILQQKQNEDLYFWLYQQLQGLKVRTVLGSSVHNYSIAFLDPRSPAFIMADPLDNTGKTSCFDYNKLNYPGSTDDLLLDAAGQPLLPCIGVLRPGAAAAAAAAAAAGNSGSLEGCYLSYPVEVCWLKRGRVKKGDPGWPLLNLAAAAPPAVQQIRLETPDAGLRWNVANVIRAGSFDKATRLRGNGDLDVLLKLMCSGAASFDCCRGEVLEALQLQLDVQVAKYHGDTEEQQRQCVLQQLLDAAAAAVLPGPDFFEASGRRVMDLSESQSAVIKGVNVRYRQRGYEGYGRLVTDVIRAVKAWSKFGLPVALRREQQRQEQQQHDGKDTTPLDQEPQTAQQQLRAAGAAADTVKLPPNYLWEVFVLYVLEQQTQRGCRYDQSRPLELFMDVMQAAPQLLRCSGPPGTTQQAADPQQQQQQQQQEQQQQEQQEPIILELYYTKQQALLFRHLWGEGPLYRPFIINPVDPTYNCTRFQLFRQWDELAAAAGALHKQLKEALQGRDRAGAAGSTAWEVLCGDSSCTLGAAVEAFRQ